jgi:hypothetical protein
VFRSSVLVLSLLVVGVVPAVASAEVVAPVRYVDGVVRVAGTAADDGYVVGVGGSGTMVAITATGAGFGTSEDEAGVCSTVSEHATCELDARPDGRTGPVVVVFDLGVGADSVTVAPGATGVQAVTASYVDAPSGLTYVGGAPAHVTVGGATGTLSGVATIVGTPFADRFTGGPAAETLAGGEGDDTFDVAGAGGPGDAVDCGAGRDAVALRGGIDVQSACEVINGIDTTAPAPHPNPLPPGPPAPPPVIPAPSPAVAGPTVKVPSQVTGKTIDVQLTCSDGGCPGSTVTVRPPTPVSGDVLPSAWPSGGSIETLLALATALRQAAVETTVKQLLAEASRAEQRYRELRARAQSTARAAELQATQAVLEALYVMLQAVVSAPTAPSPSVHHELSKVTNLIGPVKTPLSDAVAQKGKAPTGRGASAAAAASAATKAAPRATGRTLVRWLLLRTARALPTLRATLRPTGRPGVYRARIPAPAWLRVTARVLRRSGVKTLPVDLAVGATTTCVRLPLPR